MRIAMALAGVTALGACEISEQENNRVQMGTLDFLAETLRAVDVAFRDQPFDTGTVYVVTNEHGDFHTYSLTPCRGGTRVCGGSGHVGQVQRTADYYIVSDAYRDRTFYLSPGGDGYLNWQGVIRGLAWN